MSLKFELIQSLPIIESKLISANIESMDFELTKTCSYSDNKWDLSALKQEQYASTFYKYDFSKIDVKYCNYVKNLVLRELFQKRNVITTVKPKFQRVIRFIKYLQEQRIFYLNLIDKPLLIKYIESVYNSERDSLRHKLAIREILAEMEFQHKELNFEDSYEYLTQIDQVRYKRESTKGKYNYIPREFHNSIVSLALKDLQDKELSIEHKKVSAMIVIVAETGMRIGEFRILQTNQLESLKFDEDAEEFFYLNFQSYKTTKTLEWTKTFLTKNGQVAYEFLSNALADRRKDNKYLYISERFNDVYAFEAALINQLKRFFYRHSDTLNKVAMSLKSEDQKKLKKWKITKTYSKDHELHYLKESDIGRVIFRVNFHQFRVTLATILYDKGYHLDWIREHMNHMSTDMTEHYVRTEELRKLDQNVVETLLKRANETGAALETSESVVNDKYLKEELNNREYKDAYNQINKFLNKNKFNLYKDMNQIITILARTDATIMDMELGICAKALNKLCKRQEYISSIQDAYFIGVQIPSIEDIAFTFKRFQDKVGIIKHNEKLYKKNSKYRNEFERELKGIKTYIEKKLEPELELLCSEIELKGETAVLNEHEELIDIVKNLKKIKQEVLMWKEKGLKIS